LSVIAAIIFIVVVMAAPATITFQVTGHTTTGPIKTTDATASTTTATGSIIAGGGLGVVGAVNAGGAIKTTATTASTTTTTGAILSGGGLGVVGAVNAGGAIKTTATTASTSPTTGAMLSGGGLGVAGNVNFAGHMTGGSYSPGHLPLSSANNPNNSVAVLGYSVLTSITSPDVVTLSGTTGAAAAQVLYVIRATFDTNITIAHNAAGGTQKFWCRAEVDLVLSTEGMGSMWIWSGSYWLQLSA